MASTNSLGFGIQKSIQFVHIFFSSQQLNCFFVYSCCSNDISFCVVAYLSWSCLVVLMGPLIKSSSFCEFRIFSSYLSVFQNFFDLFLSYYFFILFIYSFQSFVLTDLTFSDDHSLSNSCYSFFLNRPSFFWNHCSQCCISFGLILQKLSII